jgi:hypothetical protein
VEIFVTLCGNCCLCVNCTCELKRLITVNIDVNSALHGSQDLYPTYLVDTKGFTVRHATIVPLWWVVAGPSCESHLTSSTLSSNFFRQRRSHRGVSISGHRTSAHDDIISSAWWIFHPPLGASLESHKTPRWGLLGTIRCAGGKWRCSHLAFRDGPPGFLAFFPGFIAQVGNVSSYVFVYFHDWPTPPLRCINRCWDPDLGKSKPSWLGAKHLKKTIIDDGKARSCPASRLAMCVVTGLTVFSQFRSLSSRPSTSHVLLALPDITTAKS